MIAVIIFLSIVISSPVFAWGLSPVDITINVSASGSTDQYFQVTGVSGNISVWTENISLRIEPSIVYVDASESSQWIKLTLYGNESLGNRDFDGTIDFLPVTNASVAFGIKVLTTVHQFVVPKPVLTPAPTVMSTAEVISNHDADKKSNNYSFIWIIFGCILFTFIIISIYALHKKRAK